MKCRFEALLTPKTLELPCLHHNTETKTLSIFLNTLTLTSHHGHSSLRFSSLSTHLLRKTYIMNPTYI
ncbi:hypothetical protein Hanom_Chr01g00041561 [Helianthus anomalus]